MVWQTRLPIGRQAPRLAGDGIDVGSQRQSDHVGLQAVDHRTRLLAGPVMRGADDDLLPGTPLLAKDVIDGAIEVAS
jgi:hypothetical protein